MADTVMQTKQVKRKKQTSGAFPWIGMAVLAGLGFFGYLYVIAFFEVFAAYYLTVLLFLQLAIFRMTTTGASAYEFLMSAVREAFVVTWPKANDTLNTSLVVMVSMAVASLILKLIDASISSVLSWILN